MRDTSGILAMIAVALISQSAPAGAETKITTTTVVTPVERADANMINFSEFDYNNDGILSMTEVGEKLFYLFDRDGNEVIDNIEFETNSLMTITPAKEETIQMVDFYNDGAVDYATYNYDTFLQASQLIRFADDTDGLSPKEFISLSFLQTDDNDDKAVDIQEWKEEYIAMVKPASAEQERYNN